MDYGRLSRGNGRAVGFLIKKDSLKDAAIVSDRQATNLARALSAQHTPAAEAVSRGQTIGAALGERTLVDWMLYNLEIEEKGGRRGERRGERRDGMNDGRRGGKRGGRRG